jgi:hypothetical protein
MKMLWKKIRELPREGWLWSDYLRYFAMEQAFSNQVFHRLRQIENYDWLEAETVQSLMDIFEGVLGEEMVDSRCKGIRPFLEYDIFSSFSSTEKKKDGTELAVESGGSRGAVGNIPIAPLCSDTGLVVGSLDSVAGSIRSFMGSVISSSSEEWEEKEVEVEIPIGGGEFGGESGGMTKSEFFQNALLEALKKRVEQSAEYLEMNLERQAKRRWYEGRTFILSGALDLVTYRTVWEMKCTSMISKEHQLQLLLYAWFWKGMEEFYQKSPESFSDRERKYVAPLKGYENTGGKEFHLFNVKTREHLRLKDGLTFTELTDFVALWVDGKNNSVALSVHLSDAEFLRILEEV